MPAATVGMSLTWSAGGIRTLSMTCITPLLAITSGVVTLASLTITDPFSTVKVTLSPLNISTERPSVTALDSTEPTNTWYVRISVSVAFSSSVLKSARLIPASVNAWSVGAKTVNGPSPSRVDTRSAWAKAATSEP